MVTGLTIGLFEFQEEAISKLIDNTVKSDARQTVIVKSPTGSGKTIMLIGFVDEYLNTINNNTAIIWLCPGKGNLEEQSLNKMNLVAPHRKTQNLFEALRNGFSQESTTFINWELVTKKDNTAIRDAEWKNLFDRIAEAHRIGLEFIVIIDEEHSNNTSKAQKIIDHFSAKRIIRVSATATENKRYDFIEIDERDVIDAGLITKAIYVNVDIPDNIHVENDYDLLLEKADAKRKEIQSNYQNINKSIRPLVLIQFPNGEPATIKAVEEKLSKMGYTYKNGMVSKWMADEKENLDDTITNNDGMPIFMLMKQAISTGWDCPRAKILVKLREGMEENFEIQTIGRIRRMPEAVHYDNNILDCCYVYTFDEKFKNGLMQMDKAYETRRLFLKDKCKTFSLEKEIRDQDYRGMGGRDILKIIYNYYTDKYHLKANNPKENGEILSNNGYVISNEIQDKAIKGNFATTNMLSEAKDYVIVRRIVNTHSDGIRRMHSIDAIKSAIGLNNKRTKVVLERLFRKSANLKFNLIELTTQDFYAFVINNEDKIKEDFRKIKSASSKSSTRKIKPKTGIFKIPEQDFFKYDTTVKNEIDYLSNAYNDYTSGFATSLVRSTSEMLFEQYCEQCDDIEWVYKNGDTGQQYFSIVYLDALQNQWLFYADYIVMKKDGTVWIIETKGGESKGKDKNIDLQVENKFSAFKNYASKHNLSWGFVRDKDNKLYINNTEYIKDMNDDNWKPIENVIH